MSNTNAPRGMEPIKGPGGNIPCNEYRVYASVATAIYIDDPVDRQAAGTVTLATAGAGNPVLGSVVAAFDANGVPVGYVPATPGAGYTVVVADDVNQMFEMQEDGDTTDLALTDEGNNVDLVAGTGSASTNLSGWQIDSDTTGVSAAKQLRIIRQKQDASNAVGDYCRWIVKINYHRNAVGIVGAGV